MLYFAQISPSYRPFSAIFFSSFALFLPIFKNTHLPPWIYLIRYWKRQVAGTLWYVNLDKGLTDTKYSYCEFFDGRTTNVSNLVRGMIYFQIVLCYLLCNCYCVICSFNNLCTKLRGAQNPAICSECQTDLYPEDDPDPSTIETVLSLVSRITLFEMFKLFHLESR